MAFRLAINPPGLNPRLKLKAESDANLDRQCTAATLWKEIGNSRLRDQRHSIRSSSNAIEPDSSNSMQR